MIEGLESIPDAQAVISYILGILELDNLFRTRGFSCEFFGDTPLGKISMKQKILRPVKKAAVRLNLMPKSMRAKRLLKRFVFSGLVKMPAEIKAGGSALEPPTPLSAGEEDTAHKVTFCAATLARKKGDR